MYRDPPDRSKNHNSLRIMGPYIGLTYSNHKTCGFIPESKILENHSLHVRLHHQLLGFSLRCSTQGSGLPVARAVCDKECAGFQAAASRVLFGDKVCAQIWLVFLFTCIWKIVLQLIKQKSFILMLTKPNVERRQKMRQQPIIIIIIRIITTLRV